MITVDNFKQIKHNINGNPRYVIHFLNFLNSEEQKTNVKDGYVLALKKAKTIGGRKFHNKQFGGGIVFAPSNLQYLVNSINNL